MNSRDRVLKAIKFQKPDHIPLAVAVHKSALIIHGESLLEILRRYPNDFYDVDEVCKVPEPDLARRQSDGEYYKIETDEWGCVWEYRKEGLIGIVKQSPIDDWAKLKDYRVPQVDTSAAAVAKLKAEFDRIKPNYVAWGMGERLFERMQYLRGEVDLMMDIAEGNTAVEQLADMIMEQRLIPQVQKVLSAGADVVGYLDDWGTQLSLLVNPVYWRRVFKPRYKILFDMIHAGGALAWMHSDGMLLDILPDFIEIGLDAINPQSNCIDWTALNNVADHRICLAPDVDQQNVMAFGSTQQVREHIRGICQSFGGPDGGMVLWLTVSDTMPLANIETALETYQEFKYR